jgi:hypothetical protein
VRDLTKSLVKGDLSGGWYRTRRGWEPYSAPPRTGQTEALCHGCDNPHEGGGLCAGCRAGIAWLVARRWPDPTPVQQRAVAGEFDPLPGVAGTVVRPSPERRMGEAARAKISAAQRARWARWRAGDRPPKKVPTHAGRGVYERTAAHRAAIREAQLARWRRVHAARGAVLTGPAHVAMLAD